MEFWFILSLVASLFAGLQVFIQKIGSVRGYNSCLLNTYSAGISSLVIFATAFFTEGFCELSWLMVSLGLLSGLVYILSTNLRMDALKHVDVTIFLPLHKFLSPLIALVIGLVIFRENFSSNEWLGIIIGMVVPLLLINRSEKARQNNLTQGLILLVLSAVLAAAGVALNKYGSDVFASVLMFAAVSNVASAGSGTLLYVFRKKKVCTEQKDIHYADMGLLTLSLVSGIFQGFSFMTLLLAFSHGGALAVVYTIHSLYIFIPIVLSIIFFKEHWNLRKVIAIFLSLAAVGFMKQ